MGHTLLQVLGYLAKILASLLLLYGGWQFYVTALIWLKVGEWHFQTFGELFGQPSTPGWIRLEQLGEITASTPVIFPCLAAGVLLFLWSMVFD